MSLLSIIQGFCKLHALAVPTTVIGSTDTQTVQLNEIIRDLLVEMQTESKFNVTTREKVFSCIGQEDQGHLIADIGCTGYQYIVPGTFFNRTLGRELIGPVSEENWQMLHAMPSAGTEFQYRIWQDHLWLYPAPTSPYSDIAFEYMSSYTTYSAGDVNTLIELPTADSDTFVFPEQILKRGLAFRWKQIKGLPYQADETKYWDMLNNYIARDKAKTPINVSDPSDGIARPGIFVPSNSWLQ